MNTLMTKFVFGFIVGSTLLGSIATIVGICVQRPAIDEAELIVLGVLLGGLGGIVAALPREEKDR